MNAWEKVQKARRLDRPTAIQYIEDIFDDFIELHGDRLYKDDSAIVGGIASLNGLPVTVIAQEKGQSTKDKIKRNFGSPNPEGYRKALRLMKQAEKFKRPIICFVDTQGAYCGIGAEKRGQGEAVAKNLQEMSLLETPIISIIIGEGGSGGALALAVADSVWMFENAIYSILSPEGFASILYKDGSKAKEAAEIMKLTAEDLYELKVIEKIIEEPLNGAHESFNEISKNLKEDLIKELAKLQNMNQEELIDKRYKRYRQFY
jgi:acetyl-CoA carboxylase carboxyl transferase subunit alpha